MEEFWTWVCTNLGVSCPVILLFLITFIQITPIKLNPWTAIKNFFTAPYKILKAIDKINQDLENQKHKIDEIESKVSQIDEKVNKAQQENILIKSKIENLQNDLSDFKAQVKNDGEQQKAEGCRIRILRFGDEITRGITHSKEHYEQILSDIGYYDDYCKTHPKFPNHITVINSQIINDKYRQLFYSSEAPKEEDK